MAASFKQFAVVAIGMKDRSAAAAVFRAVSSIIEPFYATVTRARNFIYDRGILKSTDLGRYTISVGNITTGGTGKTPVVIWLAEQLRQMGRHPAVLLRGYQASAGQAGDEAKMLEQALNLPGTLAIPIRPNPSRVQAAQKLLAESPKVDLFLLDDGFQHRRARRDFNLVLISAPLPFGFGRVLPRGLLREPMSGLRRADAFLITRRSQISPQALNEIEMVLRRWQPAAPVYLSDHQIAGFWLPTTGETLPVSSFANQRLLLVAGIGDPVSLIEQMNAICGGVVSCLFDDHHDYTLADLQAMIRKATEAGVDRIVTTAKDWVKLEPLIANVADRSRFAVAKLELVFRADDGEQLMAAAVRGRLLPHSLSK